MNRTGGFAVHRETVYDWRRVLRCSERELQMTGTENETLLRPILVVLVLVIGGTKGWPDVASAPALNPSSPVSSRFAETRFAEISVRGWCFPDSPKTIRRN